MLRLGRKLDIEKIMSIDLRKGTETMNYEERRVICNFSGVYAIINNITGCTYIGSSKNIMRRLREHIRRPKGLLKENFSKYDRLKDYEYILPIQSYLDIVNLDIKKSLRYNDIIYKYILFIELKRIKLESKRCGSLGKLKSRVVVRKVNRKRNKLGILSVNRLVKNKWYKNLEGLYIKKYNPKLNSRKVNLLFYC